MSKTPKLAGNRLLARSNGLYHVIRTLGGVVDRNRYRKEWTDDEYSYMLVGWTARFLTRISLNFSCYLIYLGITQKEVIVGSGYYSGCSRTIIPGTGLRALVVGLLLCGISIYTLKITSGWMRWRDLHIYKKAIAAIPVVIGLPVIVTACYALCYASILAGLCEMYSGVD